MIERLFFFKKKNYSNGTNFSLKDVGKMIFKVRFMSNQRELENYFLHQSGNF
ncbi:hypothetical protein RV07_GL000947 [Enterococcus malodoratus]|nr:hypothetical protein RV07_GL000947 [Enterococcus malodoratus]